MDTKSSRRGGSSRGRSAAVGVWVALACVLSGCASGGLVDKTLELVGLKPAVEAVAPIKEVATSAKDELANLPINREVTLRLHAGQVLNTDASGRALSVVTRIYKLRAVAQFSQATYPMFAANDAAAAPFASEVVSMNEVVLKPGQKFEVVETLPLEATHFAVVALFRAPDAQRWRFVFDAKAAVKSGITMGAHACALSVSIGEPLGASPDALRLAGVQCRSGSAGVAGM